MTLLKKIFSLLAMALALVFCPTGVAMQSYGKQWNTAVVIGAIPNSNFRYYFEPQIRLISNRYFFNQSLILGGCGYQLNPNLILFTGLGWIHTKSLQGVVSNENRIWQQANWKVLQSSRWTLDSRTRLEERKHNQHTEYAYRFRQRLWLRIPLKIFPSYSFSCFDEIFFNLNHPSWVSPYFFEQNRTFIGINKQLSNNISVDIGYQNQYIHSRLSQLDHVLLICFNINLN